MESTPCLVLSGGIALGAYQAGAYTALHETPELQPRYIAGSSVGAVNGAIIAATPPEARIHNLEAFWRGNSSDGAWPGAGWVHAAPAPIRRAYRWNLALQTRLFGCPGVMRPRTLSLLFGNALSLYDLSPLRARLADFIDFERLNRGEVRFSVTTTDVEQGEPVVFDTARGDTIGPDHLIASCGFLPEFPPVEIGGRLLGDGGLSANAPLEAVLEDDRLRGQDVLCFAIDLFAAEGRRPTTLAGAATRSLDLFFGAQTVRTLRALGKNVVSVRYHVRPDEPGPHRLFDFSTAALADRWAAGRADMTNAVDARRRLAFA